MPLNNVRIESAKPRPKPYKLGDEKGLYLLVQPTGQKWWRLKYRFGARKDGKPGQAEKMLSLGVYPDVSLKRARERRDEARQLLADGWTHQHSARQTTTRNVSRIFIPLKPSPVRGSTGVD